MKKIAYFLGILFLTCNVYAQDLTDALRYSNYKVRGTARAAAMGNAFGALGGDFTSLSINPAGIAVYRSGEFTFTPSLMNTSVDGSYMGTTSNDSKSNFGIDNLGYVTTIPAGSGNESGIVSFSFGVGFNRMAGFSMNSIAQTSRSNNSILDYFTDYMNNNHDYYFGHEADLLDPYYELLAWDTYLVNHYSDQNVSEYFNDVRDFGYNQSQRRTTSKTGYINEFLISFGANFNHKLYVGGTIGIQDLYYKENAMLKEWYPNGNNPYFDNLNFSTYLKTAGNGYNIKLGAIVKPTESLRLGLAFHSPTFYSLSDNYYNTMKSRNADESGTVGDHSAKPDQEGVYDYKIETPMKVIFSGAYLFGKQALVSVDYELINYSSAKIKSNYSSDDFTDKNQKIKDALTTAGNLHIGGEYRLTPGFSLRAGYENYATAFKSTYLGVKNPNADAKSSTLSAGFGIRQGNVFFDAAFKHITSDEYQTIYPESPELAKYSSTQNNVVFTIGYKF